MTEYFRSRRPVPLWLVLGMAIAIAPEIQRNLRPGGTRLIAMVSILGVAAYAVASGCLNRTWVRVNWQGVARGAGPLPVAPNPDLIRFDQVRRVYVRHAIMRLKATSVPYLAAGIERIDGRWLDVSAPRLEDAVVRREAAEIALALACPRPVEELTGEAPSPEQSEMRAAWFWGGAVLASIVWFCAVEFGLAR